MPKIAYTIKLESVLLKRVQRFAKGSHRSVNNFIELAIIQATKGRPQNSEIDEHSPENIDLTRVNFLTDENRS